MITLMSDVTDLKALLIPNLLEVERAWSALTDWQGLQMRFVRAISELRTCSEATRSATADEWREAARHWEEFFDPATQASLNSDAYTLQSAPSGAKLPRFKEFVKVAAMLVVDESAMNVDRMRFSHAAGPDGLEADLRRRAWGRLLIPDRYVCGYARTTVALVDQATNPVSGFLGLLELTILNEGTGVVCPHPACDVDVPESFAESMRVAFSAALTISDPQKTSSSEFAIHENSRPRIAAATCDGVWLLSRLSGTSWSGEPLDPPTGASAGGAATRGWWHALNEKYPDDELVVIAEIARHVSQGLGDPPADYQLHGVDVDGTDHSADRTGTWVRAKVEAVARDKRFDTIVMVDDEKANHRFISDEFVKRLNRQFDADVRIVWLGKGETLFRD
jgi:hypothetical protein